MMGEASRGCLVDAEGAGPGQGAALGTLAGGTIHALSDCLPATGAPAPVKSSLMIVLFIVLSRIKHRIPLGRVRTP